MSNIFANTKPAANDSIEEDFLGGGGVLETDLYPFEVKAAYIGNSSKSKAMCVNLILNVDGKEYNEQIWVTNGKGSVTYEDKKTKEAKNLPGYSKITSLSLLMLGQELGEMNVEERTLKIYDYDAKKELPQAVDCFVDLHGKKGQVAIQKQIVDKTKLNDQSGKYETTGDTRNQNEIIKFFAEDKPVTISELSEYVKSLGHKFDDIRTQGDMSIIVGKMPEDAGSYAVRWLEKNRGQVYNKAKGTGTGEGKSFAGAVSKEDSVSSAKTSLFAE